jgi:hypothetical protein
MKVWTLSDSKSMNIATLQMPEQIKVQVTTDQVCFELKIDRSLPISQQ